MKKNFALFWILLVILTASHAAAATPRKGSGSGARASAAAAEAVRFEVNSATIDELEQVPGIGKAMAERIVAYRAKQGSFTKLEELVNVRGIGEKKLAKLAPHLFVGPKSAKAGK